MNILNVPYPSFGTQKSGTTFGQPAGRKKSFKSELGLRAPANDPSKSGRKVPAMSHWEKFDHFWHAFFDEVGSGGAPEPLESGRNFDTVLTRIGGSTWPLF